MIKKIALPLLGVLLALLGVVGFTAPASAAHTGQKHCNSGASDNYMVVRTSAGYQPVDPGGCYTVKSADVSGFTVSVYGDSFRVRYDKTIGAYQACQNIESNKTFSPANGPERIDYLSYGGPNCQHQTVSASGASGQVTTTALDGRAGRAGRAVVQPVAMLATAGTVCAGTSGLTYDADYSNGYSWFSVSKGSCKTWQPRAKWRAASGDKSMAVVGATTAGPGAVCSNTTVIQVANPGGGVRVNVASYDETGCRN